MTKPKYDGRYADLAEAVLTLAREIRLSEVGSDNAIALTQSNVQVMRFIDTHPGAMPSEVAEATGLLRSNLSTAVRELEAIGFIEKRRDPDDGRGVRLHSTPEAARNVALLRAEWSEGAAKILESPDGVESATQIIRRLSEGLTAQRRESGRRWNRRQL